MLKSRRDHVSQARMDFPDGGLLNVTQRCFSQMRCLRLITLLVLIILLFAMLESIGRRFTPCDDETLSAYEHLSRCVYTQSDAARHIFAPLQYITALVTGSAR